jgi:hypothetical protein
VEPRVHGLLPNVESTRNAGKALPLALAVLGQTPIPARDVTDVHAAEVRQSPDVPGGAEPVWTGISFPRGSLKRGGARKRAAGLASRGPP